MLKRRYRSTEENEKLRRLDYFNQPFEPGNDIRLIDDIDMEQSVALLSLSAEFDEVDPGKKRGSSHAMEREVKKKKEKSSSDTFSLFDEFDETMSDYTTK